MSKKYVLEITRETLDLKITVGVVTAESARELINAIDRSKYMVYNRLNNIIEIRRKK